MEQSAGHRYRNFKDLQIDPVLLDCPENTQDGGFISYLLSLCMLPILSEREWPQNKGFVNLKSVKLHADGSTRTRARWVKLPSSREVFSSVVIQSTFLVAVFFVQGSGSFAQKKLVAHPAPTPITLME